ncbi:MAG: hypothetical protein WAS21_31700 [Geminicoccaceae bacterium]
MNFLRLLLPLLPTLLKLLPEVQQATTHHLARRLMLHAALIAIPVLLLLLAFAFASAASFMALETVVSPHAAAAIMALGLCGLAALVAVVLILLDRAAERRREQALATARASALAPLHEAGRLIANKPLQSMALAAAAGVVLAWLGRRD